MTDKENFRAEIERRYNEYMAKDSELAAIRADECLGILSYIDSMQEECNITGVKSRHATGKLKECIDNQTEEGLEQARKQLEENPQECMYARDNYTDEDRKNLCEGCEEECRFSRKGLNTSERELIATREALAYVNNINRGESPWVDSDMEEAYEEGYKAGAKWQRQKDEHLIWQTSTANYEKGIEEGKQQMIKDAVDGVITFDYYKDDKAYGCVAHDSFCLEDSGLRDCDKVKMIVLKEK